MLDGMHPTRLVVALSAFLAFGQEAAEPWSRSEVIEPAALATLLKASQPPMVISVAFPVLHRSRHIAGAVDAGAASKPDGITALRNLVSGKPKDTPVVVYCGCCPMEKCPNVRPAYRALKELGFQNVRVLNVPTNMAADWYGKGYPSEPGSPAPQHQ